MKCYFLFPAFPVEISRRAKSAAGYWELLSQTEFRDDRAVSFDILLLQIAEQILSVTDHLGQTSLGMEVLRVLFEVFGQNIDPLGEDGDLYLGGAGVAFAGLVLLDQSGFGFFADHNFSPFFSLCRKLRQGQVPPEAG